MENHFGLSNFKVVRVSLRCSQWGREQLLRISWSTCKRIFRDKREVLATLETSFFRWRESSQVPLEFGSCGENYWRRKMARPVLLKIELPVKIGFNVLCWYSLLQKCRTQELKRKIQRDRIDAHAAPLRGDLLLKPDENFRVDSVTI